MTGVRKASGKAKWTIIVYGAADNNLLKAIRRDIIQMRAIKEANEDVNVVGILDNGFQDSVAIQEGNLSPEASKGKVGAFKFELSGGPREGWFPGKIVSYDGQVNMGDPKTLEEVILWAMRKYPAEHYAVLILDHGNGWQGIAEDEDFVTKKGDDRLTADELREALREVYKRTGRKVDLLMMDACLMGQLEVLFQVEEFVNYVIASEDREGEEGWDYSRLNFKLPSDPKKLAEAILNNIYDGYSVRTLSLYDLKALREFKKAFNSLLKYLLKEIPKEKLRDISKRIRKLPSISQGYFYDFKDFGGVLKVLEEELKGNEKGEKLLKSVKEALSKLVVDSRGNTKNLTGLSVDANDMITEEYLKLKFAKETLWDEFLIFSREGWKETGNQLQDG